MRAVLIEQGIVRRAELTEAEIDRLVDGISMRLDGAGEQDSIPARITAWLDAHIEASNRSAFDYRCKKCGERLRAASDAKSMDAAVFEMALAHLDRCPERHRAVVVADPEVHETVPGEIIANAWPPGRGEVVRATSGDAIRAADEAIRAAQGRWQSNGPPTPPVQRDDRVRRNWAAREGKPVPPPCRKSPDCVAPPHIGNCVTAAQIDAWAAEPPARARYDVSEPAGRSGSLARLRSIPRPFIPGDLWHDQHGTTYDVVRRADVGDRPRWWLTAGDGPDQLWMPGKEHLHRLPAADAATMALVARDVDRAVTVLDVLRSPEGRAAIAECMSRPPQRMPDGTWREPTPGTTARPGDIIRHRDGRPGGEVHRVDGDTLWLRQEGGGGYEAVLAVDVEVVWPALGRDGAR